QGSSRVEWHRNLYSGNRPPFQLSHQIYQAHSHPCRYCWTKQSPIHVQGAVPSTYLLSTVSPLLHANPLLVSFVVYLTVTYRPFRLIQMETDGLEIPITSLRLYFLIVLRLGFCCNDSTQGAWCNHTP